MPASLYEQFLAVGSVKSLLTGKEISTSQTDEKITTKDQTTTSSPEKQT